MSGLFMLGLIAAWIFVGWLIYLIWGVLGFGAQDKLVWKTFHRIIGVGLFSVWFGVAFWAFAGKKMYYDAQVRDMCKKDGGVTIYETVVLPKNNYAYYDKHNWIMPNKENAKKNGDKFYAENSVLYFRESDPKISRVENKIVRISDNKVLGVYVSYGRGGGDIPGFGHPSSFICPEPKTIVFETKIFIEGDL